MGGETFYDILGVSPSASIDEIKKRYKVLALKLHPDKNLEDTANATERFRRIQEAYGVLSDPKERDWYDRHKESFHRDVDVQDHSVDEIYLSGDCFSGYGDDAKGFYAVYRTLFEEIVRAEEPHREGAETPLPADFGDSSTDVDEVKAFYDVWHAFSTSFTFAHLDRYDIRDAPNRRVARLMEKENKKIRDQARKCRNVTIQSLVAFVRKRDKRMQAYRKRLEAKREENRQKSEAHRRMVIEDRNRQFESYVQCEWTSLKDLENELNNMVADADDHSYYEKKKKKKKTKNTLDANKVEDENCESKTSKEDETSSADRNPCDAQTSTTEPIDAAAGQQHDSSNADQGYYCEVCNKKFKTLNSFQNHEKSKKHLVALQYLRTILTEQDTGDRMDDDEPDGD